MTSDPSVIVMDAQTKEETLPSSPVAVATPNSSAALLTPQSGSIGCMDSDLSITPTQVKRAGADISNLPVSTPKRPKTVHRRTPLEIARDRKEKEEKRLERQKQLEEARLRKLEEQKKKDEAKQKREEARLEVLKKKQEEQDKRDEERRKKEEARLEALKKKQEEQDKREEERRKKEDARLKKEEEKRKQEEEKTKEKEAKEKKDLKLKSQFRNFFKSPSEKKSPPRRIALVTTTTTTSRFRDMHIPEGMTVTPVRRRPLLSSAERETLDRVVEHGTCDSPTYLAELAERVRNQGFCLAGPKRKPREGGLQPKLLQFSKDHRPAYWGTWRKKSSSVRPCNPFGKEEALDYDYDSEAEWEEEEPGESLSHSEGEEKEEGGEKDDDDEDDGFFVPHGYLSDDERGGSDMEHEADPSATEFLRKFSQGPVIYSAEQLCQFPVVSLVTYCPVDPLMFALKPCTSTPVRKVA